MPPKKRVKFSDFDREVLARLPISAEQREELIKSIWEHEDETRRSRSDELCSVQARRSDTVSIDSEVRVEVMSKPSIGPTPVVDV